MQQSPPWLVQVGGCPPEQAEDSVLAACAWGCPVLLLPNHPGHHEACAAELERLAAPQLWLSPVLLAAAAGECCWYRYNDLRLEGRLAPELLEEGRPNLRLQGLELRPVRPLDTVIEAWAAQAQQLGPQLLEGGGWLQLELADPLPVLAGAIALLARVAEVHWRPPPRSGLALPELLGPTLQAAGLVAGANAGSGWHGWRRP